MTIRIVLGLALAALTLALPIAGCGDDTDDDAAEQVEEAAVSPQQAIAEIALVRQGMDEGLAAYEAGDTAQAEQLVGDAYLEHFELVEPPLEEVDEELNEELEVLIRETLRDAIVAGEPVSQVEKLVMQANKGLDEAEAALGGSGKAAGSGGAGGAHE